MTTRVLGIALILALLTGCTYGKHRWDDATDIFDYKWGCNWESVGFGGKVEISDYFGVGVGVARFSEVRETYGRHELTAAMDFVHLIVVGADGPHWLFDDRTGSAVHAFGVNCCQYPRPLMVDRFRIGVEIMFINFMVGLYLNTGQLFDGLAGITTWDPAGDDGLPRRIPMDWEPERPQ